MNTKKNIFKLSFFLTTIILESCGGSSNSTPSIEIDAPNEIWSDEGVSVEIKAKNMDSPTTVFDITTNSGYLPEFSNNGKITIPASEKNTEVGDYGFIIQAADANGKNVSTTWTLSVLPALNNVWANTYEFIEPAFRLDLIVNNNLIPPSAILTTSRSGKSILEIKNPNCTAMLGHCLETCIGELNATNLSGTFSCNIHTNQYETESATNIPYTLEVNSFTTDSYGSDRLIFDDITVSGIENPSISFLSIVDTIPDFLSFEPLGANGNLAFVHQVLPLSELLNENVTNENDILYNFLLENIYQPNFFWNEYAPEQSIWLPYQSYQSVPVEAGVYLARSSNIENYIGAFELTSDGKIQPISITNLPQIENCEIHARAIPDYVWGLGPSLAKPKKAIPIEFTSNWSCNLPAYSEGIMDFVDKKGLLTAVEMKEAFPASYTLDGFSFVPGQRQLLFKFESYYENIGAISNHSLVAVAVCDDMGNVTDYGQNMGITCNSNSINGTPLNN